MKLGEIKNELGANLLTGEGGLETDCLYGCGCDLMSDVLAFSKLKMVLLTGLTNIHVIRTCEMLDVVAVVFVRGKVPSADIIEAAEEAGISLLSTDYTLYEACGRLYKCGLPGKTEE